MLRRWWTTTKGTRMRREAALGELDPGGELCLCGGFADEHRGFVGECSCPGCEVDPRPCQWFASADAPPDDDDDGWEANAYTHTPGLHVRAPLVSRPAYATFVAAGYEADGYEVDDGSDEDRRFPRATRDRRHLGTNRRLGMHPVA